MKSKKKVKAGNALMGQFISDMQSEVIETMRMQGSGKVKNAQETAAVQNHLKVEWWLDKTIDLDFVS